MGKILNKCATCKEPYERYASQIKHRGTTYCSVDCKKVGMVKAKSKSQIIKLLDNVYSRYIRLTYAKNGSVSCVSCGQVDDVKHMQNGHYVSRQFHATRWLDRNCHPQCYRCNVALEGNYPNYTMFMIRTYGPQIIEELIELSKVTPKFSKQDLMDKLTHYTKLVEDLQGQLE